MRKWHWKWKFVMGSYHLCGRLFMRLQIYGGKWLTILLRRGRINRQIESIDITPQLPFSDQFSPTVLVRKCVTGRQRFLPVMLTRQRTSEPGLLWLLTKRKRGLLRLEQLVFPQLYDAQGFRYCWFDVEEYEASSRTWDDHHRCSQQHTEPVLRRNERSVHYTIRVRIPREYPNRNNLEIRKRLRNFGKEGNAVLEKLCLVNSFSRIIHGTDQIVILYEVISYKGLVK